MAEEQEVRAVLRAIGELEDLLFPEVKHEDHEDRVRNAARALYAHARPTRPGWTPDRLPQMPHTEGDALVHGCFAQVATSEMATATAVFDGLALGLDDAAARGLTRTWFMERFEYALEWHLATSRQPHAEKNVWRAAAWKWCHEGAVRVFGADDDAAFDAAYARARNPTFLPSNLRGLRSSGCRSMR